MVDTSRRSFLRAVGTATGGVTIGGTALVAGEDVATGHTSRNDRGWPMAGLDASNTGNNPSASPPMDRPFLDGSYWIDGIRGAPAVVDGVAYAGGAVEPDDDADDPEFEPRGLAAAIDLERETVRWVTDIESNGTARMEAPAVWKDTVFVGGERTMYALASTDGTTRWTIDGDAYVSTVPAVVDGTLYFATDSRLRAVDAASGEIRWTYDDGVEIGFGQKSYKRVAVADGTVYYGGGSGLVALSAADGSVRWKNRDSAGMPTVADGMVIYTRDYRVGAVDASDGTGRWSLQLEGPDVPIPVGSAVVAGDRVVVPSEPEVGSVEKGLLTAISLEDGTVEWDRIVDGAFPGHLAASGETLFVGFRELLDRIEEPQLKELWAIDAADGSPRWKVPVRGHLGMSAPAVAGDSVYCIDDGGFLYEHSADAPSIAWRSTLGDPPAETDVLAVTDDADAIGAWDERVALLDADDGDAAWQSDLSHAEPTAVVSAGGNAVVATLDQLRALDTADGTTSWAITHGRGYDHIAVHDESLYTMRRCPEHALVSIDAGTGEVEWVCTADGPLEVHRAPHLAVRDETVFVRSDEESLVAIDRDDGRVRWRETFTSIDDVATSPGFDRAYIATGAIAAIDAADGAVGWRHAADDIAFEGVTAGDGAVYATGHKQDYRTPEDDRRHFVALDAADGTERWRVESAAFEPFSFVQPPIYDDDVVFLPMEQRLSAFDAQDGTHLGSVDTLPRIHSLPAVGSERVYVMTTEGTVYGIVRDELTGTASDTG